jgi:NAD(P)-dependent dehydrogenase (short-subunit alcohol dehydrogenase family)
VCNAAVNPYFGPLAAIPDEAYDKTMNANVRSTVWLCNMVLPEMAQRGGGAAILLTSIAGVRGSAVVDHAAEGIRVNVIAPGVIRTDLSRVRWAEPEDRARTVAAYPLGRLGEPDDVAGVVVMLAGRAGAFITGQTIVVDGGVTIAGG